MFSFSDPGVSEWVRQSHPQCYRVVDGATRPRRNGLRGAARARYYALARSVRFARRMRGEV